MAGARYATIHPMHTRAWAAIAGSIGESLGYYGCVAFRDLRRSNAQHRHQTAGARRSRRAGRLDGNLPARLCRARHLGGGPAEGQAGRDHQPDGDRDRPQRRQAAEYPRLT